jgi:hypothetical protein
MNRDLHEQKVTNTFANGHALVIAVAGYREINVLPTSVLNDGRDVAAVLTSTTHCGYLQNNVRMLLDDDATSSNMRNALAELASAAGTDDTVIIFFSGHGARVGGGGDETSALLPVDCSSTDIEGTSVSETEFSRALADIKSSRILVMLDGATREALRVSKANIPKTYRLDMRKNP